MIDITPVRGLLPHSDFEITVTFLDKNRVGIEGVSDSVHLVIEKPDQTNEPDVTGASLEDLGGGSYRYVYSPPMPGTYHVRGRYLGANKLEIESCFEVSTPQVQIP
jgi:hypothetical protein